MGEYHPESRMMAASETRLPEAQESCYEEIVPAFKKRAIDMRSFNYTDLEKDLEYVRQKEERIAEENRKRNDPEAIRRRKSGELFEAIMDRGVEMGFLGQDANSIVPSRYDDFHGIDNIVEFENVEGMTAHLALGIDVTRDAKEIEEKLYHVKKNIESGKLSEVKYFSSPSMQGRLRNVARVIVGADQATIDGISDLIVRSVRLEKTVAESKRMKNEDATRAFTGQHNKVSASLGTHPLQWIVLDEIQQQLLAYRKYAEQEQQTDVVREYDKILGIVSGVIEAKRENEPAPDLAAVRRDEVYQLIQEKVKSF